MRSRHERGEWVLEGAGESLRFFIGELKRSSSPALSAKCAPLADGGVLAALTITISEGFDSRTCFLQLEPAADGWRPMAVGVYVRSDFGFFWLESLRGRVLIDSRADGLIDCRVEFEPNRGRAFVSDFRVDPTTNSADLRKWILDFDMPGSPRFAGLSGR